MGLISLNSSGYPAHFSGPCVPLLLNDEVVLLIHVMTEIHKNPIGT